MKKLLPIFFIAILLAAFVAVEIDVSRLYRIFQPVIVCLSIMAAAIFVRLNRGLPTLEWKSLTADQRKSVTSAVLRLAKDYVIGLILTSISIVLLVVFSAVSPQEALTIKDHYKVPAVFIFVSSLFFSMIWMAYVIWRDYDIVRLQKAVIDDAAEREKLEQNSLEAKRKMESMRASGLKAQNSPVADQNEP